MRQRHDIRDKLVRRQDTHRKGAIYDQGMAGRSFCSELNATSPLRVYGIQARKSGKIQRREKDVRGPADHPYYLKSVKLAEVRIALVYFGGQK